MGRNAVTHGVKFVSDCFNVKLIQSMSLWEHLSTTERENGKQTPFKKKCCLNLLNDNFLNKVKYLMIWTRAAGLVISHPLVIAIAKLAVKGNNPTMLIINGGPWNSLKTGEEERWSL